MYVRRLLYVFAVALAVLSSNSLQAQTCAREAWYYDAATSCATNAGGLCSVGAEVAFQIRTMDASAQRACATVKWSFGDGTPDIIAPGDVVVRHAFAKAGTFNGIANITSTVNGVTSTRHDPFVVQVGHGRVALFSTGSATVMEGESMQFAITRTNVIDDTEVGWIVRPVGAPVTPGIVPAQGTVTIPAGATSATVTLNAVDDAVYTGVREFQIFLASASGAYIVTGTPIWLEVRDDDYSVVDFADEKIVVQENAGLATIRLKRTRDISRLQVIAYEVSGNGVMNVRGTAVFDAGLAETSFQVAVVNDTTWARRSAQVLLWASQDVHLPNDRSTLTRTITIEDDEPPRRAEIIVPSIVEGNAGASAAKLRVVLSSPAPDMVEFAVEARPGTARAGQDYTFTSHSFVRLQAGATEATIPLIIYGDEEIEADETVLVRLLHTFWSTGNVVLPESPAVITILNDDAGLGPDRLPIPKGGRESAFIDLGSPAATDLVIPLLSGDPAAVEVPASVTVPAGKARAVFEVTGHVAGAWARVTAKFPPPMGEKFIKAEVYEPAELVLDPGAIKAHPGQEITVRASLNPPAGETRRIRLQAINGKIASVPQTVDIPAGGEGTFVVKALTAGWTSIAATLPDANGGGSRTLDVLVEAAPDAPLLRSVVPSTGPTAGGTAFEAYGAHLSADCTMRFGGVPATGLALANDGLLTGVTPAHAAGVVDVTLQCGGQTSVLANGFTYIAAKPTLSSVMPSFGSTAGGTHVRVTGTNIANGCWLFFGGTASPAVETNGTAEITGVTPPRATAGAVEVALRCTDSSVALPAAFAYTTAAEPAPSIISVTPLAAAPGEPVTITGSRFRPSDRVTFDDTSATILRTAPDTHVIRVPELPLGMSSITLTDAAGRATTTGPIFAVLEPERPQIVSVSPTVAVAGSELVLTGRAFRPAYSFAVGSPAQTVDLSSERVVIRLAGDLEPGTYPIHLRNAAGQLAIVGPSVVVGTQGVSLRAVDPACGTSDGGAQVTIHGNGFAAGAAVAFNGVAATNVEVVSATEIRATAPAGATGLARITVTNANGDEGAITNAFRYRSPFDPNGCGGPPSRGRSVRH